MMTSLSRPCHHPSSMTPNPVDFRQNCAHGFVWGRGGDAHSSGGYLRGPAAEQTWSFWGPCPTFPCSTAPPSRAKQHQATAVPCTWAGRPPPAPSRAPMSLGAIWGSGCVCVCVFVFWGGGVVCSPTVTTPPPPQRQGSSVKQDRLLSEGGGLFKGQVRWKEGRGDLPVHPHPCPACPRLWRGPRAVRLWPGWCRMAVLWKVAPNRS
jgi:hypothetical protein